MGSRSGESSLRLGAFLYRPGLYARRLPSDAHPALAGACTMDLLAAWLLFPLLLTGISLGIGLLLERATGRMLPGALLVPVGFAGALVTCRMLTHWGGTASLALWACLVLALAGAAAGWRGLRRRRVDVAAVAAALVAFALLSAPVALTGKPTFAGSGVLPDTAHQLALAASLPEHGPNWQEIPNSSHRIAVYNYTISAYPVAPQATLGALAPLGLLDIAWLYQPFINFMLAMIPLAVYALLATTLRWRWARGFAAFVTGLPALTVGYAMQGSIKEVATASLLSVIAALAVTAFRARARARDLLPLTVVAVATLGSLGPAGVAYLGPLLLLPVVAWIVRTVRAPTLGEAMAAIGLVALAAFLLLPILANVQTAYAVNKATLQQAQDLGNLPGPLSPWQVFGAWLNGDYRFRPHHAELNVVLVAMAALPALWGLIEVVRRRALAPLAFTVPVVITSLYLLPRGSPYADGKVLAVLAPAVILLAGLGAGFLLDRRRRAIGFAVAAAVGVALLVSQAAIYHQIQNAPYDRYNELLKIGDRLKGKGPTLVTEYDEFTQYLLRNAQPWSQPEWPHGYRGGSLGDPRRRPSIKTPMDLDDLTVKYIESIPNIVVRRSPAVTRPPANYHRTYLGRYYEVWRREPGTRHTVMGHLALGPSVFQPGGPAGCRGVRRLAAEARRVGGRLAYVARPRIVLFDPRSVRPPYNWFNYANYPKAWVPVGQGQINGSVRLPTGGRFRLWIEGSFGRKVKVLLDGREVGPVSYEYGNPGQYLPLGWVSARPGVHPIKIVRGGGDLRPGNGGGSDSSLLHIGAVEFSGTQNEARRVRTVSPAQARSLCGRWLDWVEAVRRS